MTPYETQAIDDALWYLRHGDSAGALSILRGLHGDQSRDRVTSGSDAPREVPPLR